MNRIAITGATGSIGQLIVAEAEKKDLQVVSLSRSTGIDLLTGAGLEEALANVDAVIDASQVGDPTSEDPVTPILTGARHLIDAAKSADVGRLVMLSINGVQDKGLQQFPFYDARAKQEKLVADSGLTTTIVRSSQWFEFALNPAAVTENDENVVVQDWNIQPAAASSIARYLVEAALGEHGDGVVTVCGPDAMRLPALTEAVLAHRDDARPVDIQDPPLAGLGDGTLLAPEGSDLVGPTLDQWLNTSH